MVVSLRLLSAVNTSVSANNAGLTSTQSDYVVILAALFCALICAVGLAMAARCVCLYRPFNLFTTAPVFHTSAPPPSGLSKKTLQLLPTTKYLCEADDSNKQDDCAICLTEFSDGEMMRVLPRCGHVFHITCIDKWLGSHSSCPSCRQLVLVAGKCHHCGGFSAHQGFHGTANEVHTRETDVMRRQEPQDYMLTYLP
ncbi:RING-H2 finger protein ATL80-like [Chenopodium quinoa]|uniref:RING-H2 finger protein ATL80-like n=1 Tax=Chenopodium quinoa TaxID=63459 RepID=UPI000B795619|nr:RING-H2 finger protein ATL80-like [Chenopodium quinoa]